MGECFTLAALLDYDFIDLFIFGIISTHFEPLFYNKLYKELGVRLLWATLYTVTADSGISPILDHSNKILDRVLE